MQAGSVSIMSRNFRTRKAKPKLTNKARNDVLQAMLPILKMNVIIVSRKLNVNMKFKHVKLNAKQEFMVN